MRSKATRRSPANAVDQREQAKQQAKILAWNAVMQVEQLLTQSWSEQRDRELATAYETLSYQGSPLGVGIPPVHDGWNKYDEYARSVQAVREQLERRYPQQQTKQKGMSTRELVERVLPLMGGQPFRASSLAGMIRSAGIEVSDQQVSAALGAMVRSSRLQKIQRGLHKGYYTFNDL